LIFDPADCGRNTSRLFEGRLMNLHLKENKMKKALLALLLLSLALTGCVYDPGGGYGYHGHGDHENRGYWGR
jgi:hypothetical protein